ncbi:MAG: NADP-dependent oxidoreductase [Hyphomicrobiales bacterium]
MKIILVDTFGKDAAFRIADEDLPYIKADEVLIKTKVAGVNPIDLKTKDGEGVSELCTLPACLGWDIAGTIERVGIGVKDFQEGDHVFGLVNFPGDGRCYAEYVSAHKDHIAPMPMGLTWEEAGSAPLVFLTAWQALVNTAQIRKGLRVLVHGAAGGLGHALVQVAKKIGAYVIGTASAKNHDFCKSIGCDEVIDYTTSMFEDECSDIDYVMDTIGGDVTLRSLKVMRPYGMLVNFTASLTQEEIELAEAMNIKATFMIVKSSGDDLKELLYYFENQDFIVEVEKVYPPEEIEQCLKRLSLGHNRGKIALKFS